MASFDKTEDKKEEKDKEKENKEKNNMNNINIIYTAFEKLCSENNDKIRNNIKQMKEIYMNREAQMLDISKLYINSMNNYTEAIKESTNNKNLIDSDLIENQVLINKLQENSKEEIENPMEPDPLYMNININRNKNRRKTRGMIIVGDLEDNKEEEENKNMKKKNAPQIKIAMSKIPGISEHLFNHIKKRMTTILNRCKIPVFDVEDYTFNKKEKNTDNKPEGDNEKKKTRENMLAKLKLGKKKDPTKKK